MKKYLSLLLILALCCGISVGMSLTASAEEAFAVGTAGSVITLLPADGTPSESPKPTDSNPFGIKTTHDVTYWNFGGGGDGRSVAFEFEAPAAGDYYLAINYNSANTRTLLVTVNDGEAQALSFARNSDVWGDNAASSKVYWNNYIVKVTLVEGSNRLVLGMKGTSGAPMFSALTLWPVSEWLTSVDNPTVDSAKTVASDSAFDGFGFDVGSDLGSVTWDVKIATPGTYKISIAYSTSSAVAPTARIVPSLSIRKTSPAPLIP